MSRTTRPAGEPDAHDADSWIDVTRALPSGHPVWPGDAPFTLSETARIPDGSPVNLLRASGTTHLGTHVDAPWHYDDEAARFETVPLSTLIGEATVVHVEPGTHPIEVDELPAAPLRSRVLVRTGQPDAWSSFPEVFRSFTPGAIAHLARAGAILIGTDAPSVDALTSKDLAAHRACLEAGVIIVEGLALASIASGAYTLMCLPMRLVGADAAPARVLLRPVGA